MSVRAIHGDCLTVLPTLGPVDAIVCDPPYHLTSLPSRSEVPGKWGQRTAEQKAARAAAGFMGQQWDGGDIAFRPETWATIGDALKPGGYLLAFGGTRTWHRLACAIEDAGFEIRDTIMYVYGTGFPKSLNLDRLRGDVVCGCDHPLRGVREAPHNAARMVQESQNADLLAPVQRSSARTGMGGARVEGARCEKPGVIPVSRSQDDGRTEPGMERRGDVQAPPRKLRKRPVSTMPAGTHQHGPEGRLCDGASASHGEADRATTVANRSGSSRGSRTAQQRSEQSGTLAGQSQSQDGRAWPNCGRCGKPIIPRGLGTALKPSYEPIIVARKPLEGAVADNVLRYGTGALSIDECRVAGEPSPSAAMRASGKAPSSCRPGEYGDGHAIQNRIRPEKWLEEKPGEQLGRWPANLCHDGSDEVLALFPQTTSGHRREDRGIGGIWGAGNGVPCGPQYGDTGSAARFFFSAKAASEDRWGSRHPTVKPVALMKWLVQLVTPLSGIVLDPFAGSGTTGVAALATGRNAILVERESNWFADIQERIAFYEGEGRHSLAAKARHIATPRGAMPLFEAGP